MPRQNGWQLAEQAGAATPWSTQRLLGAARWDADRVRHVVLSYVVERLGEAAAVLVVDETGFLKKGNRSATFSGSTRARRGGLRTVRWACSWATRPRVDGC
ncbi:transposase [Streptomyces sp. NPDC002405]